MEKESKLMSKIEPTEIKIMVTSILGTIVLNVDLFMRFLAPLTSAVVWFYLKPQLTKWQEKRRQKKLKKDE